jgi:hypothetical protein
MFINPMRRLLTICIIFCFAIGFGFAGDENRSSSGKSDDKPLVRVVEEVFDDGWKTARETVVKRDGSYRMTIHNLGKAIAPNDSAHGNVPALLMRPLQEDLSKKKGFELVDGVQTYRFGIDDSGIRHPAGIAALLRFLADENSPEVALVVRFTAWPPKTESDKIAQNQLRVLLAHPRFRRLSARPKDGGLEFRVWIQDTQNTIQMLKTPLSRNDRRWSDIKNKFPDLKIAFSGTELLLFGRVESVEDAARMIKMFSRIPGDSRGQPLPEPSAQEQAK